MLGLTSFYVVKIDCRCKNEFNSAQDTKINKLAKIQTSATRILSITVSLETDQCTNVFNSGRNQRFLTDTKRH